MAAKDKLSTREKLALVKEAYRLIRRRETWIEGKWKCPLYAVGKDGGYGLKRDSKGRVVFQYCIEGALNQAAVNLFGVERAHALGAISTADESILNEREGTTSTAIGAFEQANLGAATSLDTLADEIYGPIFRQRYEKENGYTTVETLGAMGVNDNRWFGHKSITKLVRLKIKALEEQVAKLDARKKVAA